MSKKKNATKNVNQENTMTDAVTNVEATPAPVTEAKPKRERKARVPKAPKAPKAPKGIRGYTPHGYPVSWGKSMGHEEAMKLMEAQIAAGQGKKFAVKKPRVEKTGTGKRGFTTHGYPIVWLRRHTHDECMAFLAKGEKPPKGDGTKRVRAKDTGEMLSVPKGDESLGDFSFDIAGIPVAVSVDKRQYTLRINGHSTYYGTIMGLLTGMREQVIRAGVKKDASMIKSLDDLRQSERNMSSALESWVSQGGLANLERAHSGPAL